MKVAIYCRLSEEDRNKQNESIDSQSIQNQKSMLITFALEKGWEIYNIYSDDDYTGADRKRPEFKKLLADAEAGKFDIILCKTQSRFTRELELVEKYIHGLFPLWGIRFIGYADNADTAVKGNKKARQINGLVNEWYLEDLSDNIKSVLTDQRKKGKHIGAFALYGYQKDPDQKGHLIIDPDAAETVKEVYQLFADGMGATGIARMLNEKGIPNPTEYKRLKGLRYQTPNNKLRTLWKYYAIRDMLENEMYIGNMVQGKYGSVSFKSKKSKPLPKEQWIRVENTHEAIIDKSLWDKVQKMRAEKAKPMCNGEMGLFARKAKCMYCGYTMRSVKAHGYRYLKCGTRHVAADACKGAFIPQRKLEQVIVEQLNQSIERYLDLDQAEEHLIIENTLLKKETELRRNLNHYEAKVSDLEKALRDLYFDKSKGLLTDADYISFSDNFHLDMERCRKNMEECSTQLYATHQARREMKSKKDILSRYMHLTELDRDIMDALIDYIEIGRRKSREEETPVIIHWNF